MIPTSWYLKGLGILVVVLTLYLGYRYVVNLQEENAELQTEVAQLTTAIESKDKEIEMAKTVAEQYRQEAATIKKVDKDVEKKLKELRKLLSSDEYIAWQKKQRKENPEELLNVVNKQERCLWLEPSKYAECIGEK